jgi:hypothetical protein
MPLDRQQSWTPATAPAAITDAVFRGLHQAAQPLTVLQGLLELALTTPHTEQEYKRFLKRAMDESRRVGACFDAVRELVREPHAPSAGALGASSGASKNPVRCANV